MKNINIIYGLMVVILLPFLAACDEEPTQALEDIIKEDKGYLPVIAKFSLVSSDAPVVQPGMETTFDLRYWSEGDIEDIQYWLLQDDSETMIGEQAYSPAYSKVTRTDSLLFHYTLPATLQPGDTIFIEARVHNVGLEEYPATASTRLTVPE